MVTSCGKLKGPSPKKRSLISFSSYYQNLKIEMLLIIGASVKIKYDTSTQTGEFVSIVTLTTNSPLRPRLDFFINGYIK